jgi:hypothetical protein
LELAEIVKELSISALRGAQVNINMEDFVGSATSQFSASSRNETFPVFVRNYTQNLQVS